MSGIRVISGSARGRRLKMVPGEETRPIPDRVKEALFSIIQPEDIQGATFLDLFAGTGGVGIEALSRGAAQAAFLETNPLALKTIRENLALAGLAEQAQVLQLDVFRFLSRAPSASFDYIYIAPPQYHSLWSDTLHLIDESPTWLVPEGWAIAQIDPTEYTDLDLAHLALIDQRRYGNTMLCFYTRDNTS